MKPQILRPMTQSRSAAPSRGSRAQFERRVSQLPDETRARLAKGELQAADAAFYVVKSVAGSRSQKMLRDDDNKVVGISTSLRANWRKAATSFWTVSHCWQALLVKVRLRTM